MKGNTKSSRSEVLRSDRQYVWLSILLIITCVCLITSVLIISFFIYREIDRSARKPEGETKGIHDKYRGDSESASTSIHTWTTKTSTIYVPPLETAKTPTTTKMYEYTFVKTPHRTGPELTYRRWPPASILETTIRPVETEPSLDYSSTERIHDSTEVIDDSIYFPGDIPLADKESEKYIDGNTTHFPEPAGVVTSVTISPGTHRKAKFSKHGRKGKPDRTIETESGILAFKNETKVTSFTKSKEGIEILTLPTSSTTEAGVLTEDRTSPIIKETHLSKYVVPLKEDSVFRSTIEDVDATIPISTPESPKSPPLPSMISTASTRYTYTVKTAPELGKMKTYFVKSSDFKSKTFPKSIEVDPSSPAKDVAPKIRKSIEMDPPPRVMDIAPTKSPKLIDVDPPSVKDITPEKLAKDELEPKTIIKYITKEPPPPIKVCETITCKRSASRMIALMDHNVDPCEDFYSFVCRGIEVNQLKNPQYENAILAKLQNIDLVDSNTKKFKQFVESCQSFNFTEGISRVNKLIFDIFHKSDEGDKRDTLTTTLLKILSLDTTKFSFGLLPLFDFTVETDGSGSFVPTLTIPSMDEHGIVDMECIRNLSITDPDEKNVHGIYEKFSTCRQDITSNSDKIIQALRTLPSDLTVIDDIDKILAKLEKVPKAPNKRQWNERMLSIHGDPVYFSIKDLHEKYPEINWAILLNTFFKNEAAKIDKVQIMFKDYLDKIIQWYRETSLGDLSLTLRLIFTYDIYNEIFVEYNKYNIQDYCIRKAVTVMDDLATKLLLVKSNRKDLELLNEVAGDVFRNLKTQFKFSIQNTSWLTETHKNTALSTLEKLLLTADVNNLWFNDPLLGYRNGKLILTNNYVDNIVILKRNKRSIIYQKVAGILGNVWVYKYKPLSTSVWTIIKQNRIILPPGLLMKLAYKKRRSPQQYEIYALLGFQIARGIGAFFEPSQLKRLLAGIEENEVYKNYLHIRLGDPQVAKTINKYEIVASKEDLLLTKNSRFADDLAVRLSMDTYNKTMSSKELQFLWLNYTVPQLFYVALAQDFCKPEDVTIDLALQLYEDSILPNYFRVNSLLMNTIGFSDVYHCPLGSTMNPAFKADAFPHITYTEIDYL